MTTPSDRDRAWFEDLFRTHHASIRRYAWRRVGPDEVDDVVAEVFATAWRRAAFVPDPALPWLYRTAANVVLHARRTRARAGRLTSRLASEPTLPTPAVDADHPGLLQLLEPGDAEVLRLAAWEELTPSEIAYVLGITPGAARVRLHRARRRAQQLLADTITPLELVKESR